MAMYVRRRKYNRNIHEGTQAKPKQKKAARGSGNKQEWNGINDNDSNMYDGMCFRSAY